MALTIDYGLNGSEAFISKTAKMAGSVKALDGAWAKYHKTVSSGGVGKLINSGKGGGSGGGGGAGGILQNAATFYTVSKVMERLMSDRMKLWFASLVRSDVEKYKNIGKGIGKLLKPITDNIKNNTSLMYDSFKLSANVLKDQLKGNYRDLVSKGKVGISRLGRKGTLLSRAVGIKLFGRGPAMAIGKFLKAPGGALGKVGRGLIKKLPGGVRLAAIEGAMYARFAGKRFGGIVKNLIKGGMNLLTKTPLSLLVAGPLFFAMLDSRVSEWLDKKIQTVVDALGDAFNWTVKKVGDVWSGFTVALARITDNPYYAGSQVNYTKAAQANTPQQQKDFIESEVKRLKDADMEEFVRVEIKRMNDFFEKENAKRNKEIMGIQSLMMKQGRL
jgi:hypothetical protein